MKVGRFYMTAESAAAVKAAAKALGATLAANRLLRATAQTLDLDLRRPELVERRSANGERRISVDRRGAITVEEGGQTIIRPRSDLARFDTSPADVSAFIIDDEQRRHG